MDIQNFITEFKKTFIYDMLSQTLTDKQLFDYFVMNNGDIVFSKEQMRQTWSMWQAAKASVPEGFVLVPKVPAKDTLIEIASVCIGDDFANLDEAKDLYEAAIREAVEARDKPDASDEHNPITSKKISDNPLLSENLARHRNTDHGDEFDSFDLSPTGSTDAQ